MLIWDAHVGGDPRVGAPLVELERYRAAGVTYASLNVGYDIMPPDQVIRVIADYRAWIAARGDQYVLAGSVAEIVAAQESGRLALGFDLEGMVALNGQISMIELYHRLGVRQMLFAYNRNNAFASGCHDEDTGLTDLGRQAVAEMNRVGMLIDCSHTGRRATLEAMELSDRPVVFSHSNPASVWPHGRNIDDDQIRACAATGGVVCVTGIGIFLSEDDADTETMVRHLDYLVNLVGPEHVGIGLDAPFDGDDEYLGNVPTPESLDEYWPPGHRYDRYDVPNGRPSQLPEIAAALAARGYPDDAVVGIMGKNLVRVASAAWGG